MGGSKFFFIESKSFELLVEEGGSTFIMRIYERGKDSLRSIFMAKERAKQLLAHIESMVT